MKFSGLDALFYLCAVLGFILLAVMMGVNNCKIGDSGLYLVILPFMVMVGIHSWQAGKRMKQK